MAGDLARAGARDGFSESCNEINMSVLLLAFTFCERINAATPAGCIESSFSKLRLRTRSCPHECRPAYFFLFFFSNCSCATLLVNALLYCTHAPFQQRFFLLPAHCCDCQWKLSCFSASFHRKPAAKSSKRFGARCLDAVLSCPIAK